VIGEARHYDLFGPDTLGAHTALLEQHRRPLEALEMKIEIPELERPHRS